MRSHRLAAAAWDDGFYDEWVVPVRTRSWRATRSCGRTASIEALAKLRPAFRREGGTVTAGNSSALNDGAAAVLIGDARAADAIGREPLARIAGRGASASTRRVRDRPGRGGEPRAGQAGIGWGDVSVLELNEAFAAQSLACLAEWTELDPERVNVNGGAIALGHPLGASGARVLATCAYELRRRGGGGWGVAALCIGVGQGLAVVLEA